MLLKCHRKKRRPRSPTTSRGQLFGDLDACAYRQKCKEFFDIGVHESDTAGAEPLADGGVVGCAVYSETAFVLIGIDNILDGHPSRAEDIAFVTKGDGSLSPFPPGGILLLRHYCKLSLWRPVICADANAVALTEFSIHIEDHVTSGLGYPEREFPIEDAEHVACLDAVFITDVVRLDYELGGGPKLARNFIHGIIALDGIWNFLGHIMRRE